MARQVVIDEGRAVLNSASYNRAQKETGGVEPITPRGTFCIGSRCMMWKNEQRVFLLDENRFMNDNETIDSERPYELRTFEGNSVGYCGLSNG